MDEKEWELYQSRKMAEIDYNSGIASAREEGREEGEKVGIEKGERKGKKEAKIQIAKKLIESGMELEKVAQVTGLSENEIKEITTKEDLMKVIELFENTGITYWLDGGWGVDILAGKQTRIHRDIDINFDAQHTEKLLNVLLNLGYKIDTDWKPVRIELYSDELGYLDIHPFVLNEDGTSKQADLEGGWYEFEKDYFGSAFFEGKTIPCISLKGQRVFHSGYELRDKDKHDISILESLSK